MTNELVGKFIVRRNSVCGNVDIAEVVAENKDALRVRGCGPVGMTRVSRWLPKRAINIIDEFDNVEKAREFSDRLIEAVSDERSRHKNSIDSIFEAAVSQASEVKA